MKGLSLKANRDLRFNNLLRRLLPQFREAAKHHEIMPAPTQPSTTGLKIREGLKMLQAAQKARRQAP